jgi:maltooligosyltrehalose trehalohydrolase
MTNFHRDLPFGARLIDYDRTAFRLFAPAQSLVSVEIDDAEAVPMRRSPDGWFEAEVACGAGTRYRYRLGSGEVVPDPASRAQAGDVHDCSVVIDPSAYRWRHSGWLGRRWHQTVLYELHVGALGGFRGVARELPRLAALGITAVELMPVNDFPGRRNWGYDGVLPYAPDASYGTPDDLKMLVDAAHDLGLMIFLDVVYNHFGPDGNYLGIYAPQFFRDDVRTPWGAAIDFLRPEVRRFFIENALYWLMEYRFDGLRFDAVHAIGEPDWLDEMAYSIRTTVEPGRHIHLVLENDDNTASHLRGDFDAQWNDDAHHVLHVMLTNEQEGYYEDYAHECAVKLARSLAEGFIYQGETSQHRNGGHRAPICHRPPLCCSCRIMTRSGIALSESGLARWPSLLPSRRRFLCRCSPRKSRSSSWERKKLVARRFIFSATITAISQMPCARVVAGNSQSLPPLPIRPDGNCFPIRMPPRLSRRHCRGQIPSRGHRVAISIGGSWQCVHPRSCQGSSALAA